MFTFQEEVARLKSYERTFSFFFLSKSDESLRQFAVWVKLDNASSSNGTVKLFAAAKIKTPVSIFDRVCTHMVARLKVKLKTQRTFRPLSVACLCSTTVRQLQPAQPCFKR